MVRADWLLAAHGGDRPRGRGACHWLRDRCALYIDDFADIGRIFGGRLARGKDQAVGGEKPLARAGPRFVAAYFAADRARGRAGAGALEAAKRAYRISRG